MGRIIKKVCNVLSVVGSSCPYTIVGKKVVQTVKGKPKEKPKHFNDRERDLHARVQLGRNIALIGVFCPFFWISVFSGAAKQDIYFNAVHSGIVILIGLGYMFKSRFDLQNQRRKISD